MPAHSPRAWLVAALATLACLPAAADPLWTWEELRAQRHRAGGFFAFWAVDQQQVARAMRALERAGRSKAVEPLEREVAAHPINLDARDRLGLAYQRLGRIGEALEQFDRVLAYDPNHFGALLNRAILFTRLGRHALAAPDLEKLAKLEPRAIGLRERLARVYQRLGRHDDLVAVRQQLAILDRESPQRQLDLARAFLGVEKPGLAGQAARAAAALAPNEPKPKFLRVLCFRAEGNWDAALKGLEDLARRYPDSTAVLDLGFLRLHRRRFDAAAAAFEKASRTPDRRHERARLAGAAVAAHGAGKTDVALDLCRQLREKGHMADAGFLLACIWLARGDPAGVAAASAHIGGDESRAAFEGLVRATRGRSDARRELALLLGLARVLHSHGWFTEALLAAEAARKIQGESLLVGGVLARCYASAGHRNKELELREHLAKRHPGSSEAALALARVCALRGDRARAADVCRALLARSPDNLRARRSLAELHLGLGEFDAAADHARRALDKHPSDELAFRLLLDALVVDDAVAKAAQAIRKRQEDAAAYVVRAPERAILALADGRPDAALAAAEGALQRNAFDPRLRLLAALAHLRQGRRLPAIRHLEFSYWTTPDHFASRRLLAGQYLAAGRRSEALAIYAQLAAKAPGNLDIQLERCAALSRAGHRKEALELLGKLTPANDAERRRLRARLARERLGAGQLPQALADAKAVLAEEPNHLEAAEVAWRIYRARGDLDAAAALAERLAAADGGAAFAARLAVVRFVQGKTAQAIEGLGKAAGRAEGKPRVPLLTWHGAALLLAGQKDRARAAAKEALQAKGQAIADGPLIVLLDAAGLHDAAEAGLKRLEARSPEEASWHRRALPALRKAPKLAQAFFAAAAARRHGWTEKAADLLAEVRRLAPEQPAFLASLIAATAEAGMAQEALRLARQFVRLFPESGAAQLHLYRALDRAGHADDALKGYTIAARMLGPREAAGWRLVALRFQKAGKAAQAIEAYNKYLAIRPDDAAAINNLAWVHATTTPDKLPEAERLARKALELLPSVPEVHDTLGAILLLRDDLDGAARHLAAALRLNPHSAVTHYHLGTVYFRRRNYDLAELCLKRALTLEPTFPRADAARRILEAIDKKGTPGQPEPPAPPKPG